MKILDAYILARTKRKTRRIRMALVTLVSSLLFAVLFFGAIAMAGLVHSTRLIEDTGYNAHYLTATFGTGDGFEAFNASQKQATAEVNAELAARKIKVDTTMIENPEYQFELAQRASKLRQAAEIKTQTAFEKEVRHTYNPTAVYHMKAIDAMLGTITLTSEKDPDPHLKNLKEQLAKSGDTAPTNSPLEDMDTPLFYSVEEGMIQPVQQTTQSLKWKPGQPYPVIVPYAYVEKIAKRSFINVTPQEKIAGYRELIREFSGKVLTYCYRNLAAQSQLDAVLRYNKMVSDDKDKTTNPLTTPNCAGFDQAQLKKLEIIVDEPAITPEGTEPLFPQPEPRPADTRLVRFKIVGFVPTGQYNQSVSVFEAIFTSVNSWPGSMPFLVPAKVAAAEPLFSEPSVYGDGTSFAAGGLGQFYFDFATREQQKKFINEASCQGDECTSGKKPTVIPFGSVKVVMEDIIGAFTVGALWAVGAIAVIAGVLIMLVISKVIADSIKEIAVFRALGAKRLDIAQIYITYGLMLASNALFIALIIAVGVAIIVSLNLSGIWGQTLIQTVGAYDKNVQATLVGIEPLWLLAIGGVLMAAALVGIIIPIFLNSRRNLMSLMREE
jgi:hypothetical protein